MSGKKGSQGLRQVNIEAESLKLRPNRSISTRIIMYVTFISLAAILISSSVQVYKEYQRSIQFLNRQLDQIKSSNVNSLASSIWEVDTERVNIILKDINNLPNIEKVMLEGDIETMEVGGKVESEDFFIRKIPIVYNIKNEKRMQTLAHLHIYVGLDQLKGRIWALGITTSISNALTILLICLSLTVIFNTIVTKHLKKMSYFLQNFSSENVGQADLELDRKEKPGQVDEMGLLVASLNFMTQQIHRYTTDLQEIIDQKTKDISTILGHIQQGIFSIDPHGLVNEEYSQHLEPLLGTKKISGQVATDLLFHSAQMSQDKLSQVKSALSGCLGQESINFDLNDTLLVREFVRKLPTGETQIIEIDWHPIVNEQDIIEKIMVTLRDVTQIRKLQKEHEDQLKQAELIALLAKIEPGKLNQFLNSSMEFLEANQSIIKNHATITEELINQIFRNMHTIKGNARSLGLDELGETSHIAETRIKEAKNDLKLYSAQTLLSDHQNVDQVLKKYCHLAWDILGRKSPSALLSEEDLKKVLHKINSFDQAQMAPHNICLLKEIRPILSQSFANPLSKIISSTLKSLPELAKDLGKIPPKLTIDGEEVYFDKKIWPTLENCFNHLVRNHLDHGLEAADERLKLNKPQEGLIHITLKRKQSYIIIEIRDDGRGLNLQAVADKAIEKNIITASEENHSPDPHQLAQLIFHSGLSTKKDVTEISGQGVGMDAVKTFLNHIGGDIEVELKKEDRPYAQNDYFPFSFVVKIPQQYEAN